MSALPVHDPASAIAPPLGSAMWRRDFLFGAATAAFQIEGATSADGRLQSIWDTFCATPGKIDNGDTGEQACDHYHRWREDIDHVAGLGLGGYRFSIAWPRVMKEDGSLNHKGLDFYKRLLERLSDKHLEPFVTLYHWDLPQHLQDKGGWLHRDTAYRFAEYAELMGRELKGRVSAWTTLNEPWCSAWHGHVGGAHAPGLTGEANAMPAMHHLLLGHGLAMQALRAQDAAPVGLVHNVNAVIPASETPADRRAAELAHACANLWVLDPLFLGRHNTDLEELWPTSRAPIRNGDMAIIQAPMDYVGINYYFRSCIKSDGAHGYVEAPQAGVERTQMGWEIYPEGLRDLLTGFQARYANLPPVYITENGMAHDDRVVDGRVADVERIRYFARHFAAIDAAMRAGVRVKGYFAWSLLDNFEWAYGYAKRFGLVHVDYKTQQRTLKDSALALRAFLARRNAQG
jgi:beta-glucosidase